MMNNNNNIMSHFDHDNNNTCDSGLDLSLGMIGKSIAYRPQVTSMVSHDPLLTLRLSDDGLGTHKAGISMEVDDSKPGRLSSPQSAVSSFSAAYPHFVKKEKDANNDAERVSSRVSDEEEDGLARKKLRLTKEQSNLLEDRFKEHTTLNPKQKQALAKQLNLRPRQVEVWFQNRRARTKSKQTEVDCEFLRRCCERLTDENQRLHKELQELKALKFAPPPVYMQFPAATLSMCPSCERIGGTEDGTKGSSGAAGQGATGSYGMATKPRFYNPFTRSAAC